MNAVKAAQRADATREELMRQAQDAYAKASKAGGSNFASATSYIAQATGAARDTAFDNWSRSDLKAYLDSYGIPVYQGSNLNELRAAARRNAQYFKYGTTTPQGTIYASIMDTAQWVLDQLKLGALTGRKRGQETAGQARQKAERLAHAEL